MEMENRKIRWLPASKVYSEYGIPRNMIRGYAEDGRVRSRELHLDGCDNAMRVYCAEDIESLLNEA